ncbi:hypothetical protein GGS23DRAFT_595790 [Durotheca rogersii]|uniref:uncharacterized protein n=1 Tax=Durotheca rogersii TaxID=419775 RepID=UPI00221F4B37|nr:uncharacterized protein GGS23DRAFT_595790 [Durotheca rogersii]KAI5864143.1 hypothetical protein GGS23DRAFT_595790 [Durotheca rogersii]
MSWEDPHPGERLMIPLAVSAGLHIYPSTINGDLPGGVTAKARGARRDGSPCINQRGIRGRHRNAIPKPLKIPDEVPEELEVRSAPSISSLLTDITPTPSNLRLSESLSHLEFETDQESCGETGTLFGDADADADPVEVATLSQSSLSDFSNYLGISQGEDDDDASVTVVDSDAFTRASSVDDVYGWEAELSRKTAGSGSLELGINEPASRRPTLREADYGLL